MDILKYKNIGKLISESQITKKIETYLKTSRVGFEIEGNIAGIDSDYESSACVGCNDYEFHCSECDIPDDWEDCPHFRNCDGYCRYYGESVCDLCGRRDSDEYLSDGDIGSIHHDIAEELGKIPTYKGSYRENEDYLYVYNDGSVNTELVTGALRLSKIEKVLRKALDVLENYDVEISPIAHAGGHQTVSYQDFFPSIVARNTIQIDRYYLPSLLAIGCVKGSQARDSSFRTCPRSPLHGEDEQRIPQSSKYTSINFKERNEALETNFKLIEFRYPDSHKNINQVILTAIINMATIAKAFSMSSKGVAMFSQSHFNEVKSEVDNFYGYGEFLDSENVKDETHELIEYLEKEISSYANIDSIHSAVDEIINHDMLMDNGNDVGEIKLI